jgi:tetratricopeptide (TPR) repeat protein
LADLGELDLSRACFLLLVNGTAEQQFGSVATGLRGHKAMHQLGLVCRRLKQDEAAEQWWRQALNDCPGLVPAWLELANLYREQQRWLDLEEIARQLDGRAPLDAAVVRARAHQARGELATAQALLEQVVSRVPGDVVPRLHLSEVLAQQGQDQAAERELRSILEMAPGHPQATANLQQLLARRQNTAQAASDLVFTQGPSPERVADQACAPLALDVPYLMSPSGELPAPPVAPALEDVRYEMQGELKSGGKASEEEAGSGDKEARPERIVDQACPTLSHDVRYEMSAAGELPAPPAPTLEDVRYQVEIEPPSAMGEAKRGEAPEGERGSGEDEQRAAP